ncbi:PREDICTED: uncharacterized protein LOC104799810 [Tarenaya hassleriana]|uniref:uncharacterized protein LOC104799810 n=1 Tax=Tarenaya hassleriana TaxID=28532 RepID=UPI00053C134C|nr:PREDICTED: uncharacterized protein LOC104799810 [Tarenaya hassleriana]
MASFSGRFSVVSAAIIVQFLALTANSAVAQRSIFIDSVCERVSDKTYCLKTLLGNPAALAANGLFPLAEVVVGLGKAHAEKTLAFIDEAAKRDPSKKAEFASCRNAYVAIQASFRSALGELTSSPDTANYDVMVSRDQTTEVTSLIGKNTDVASKTLAMMNDQMIRFIDLATGATDAVDDDDENTFRRA